MLEFSFLHFSANIIYNIAYIFNLCMNPYICCLCTTAAAAAAYINTTHIPSTCAIAKFPYDIPLISSERGRETAKEELL